jgi:hypothetical protein
VTIRGGCHPVAAPFHFFPLLTLKIASTTSPAHTDGPWLLANGNEIVADNPQESFIAEVFDETDNWKANARLIAAAPQLLEACKVALDALNQIPNTRIDCGVHRNSYSVCSMLSAMISKAEGR